MVKTPILIFCRIKPYSFENKDDIQDYSITKGQDKETITISNLQSNPIVNHKPDSYHFQFLKVFDHTTSQNLFYEIVAQPVVKSALNGYNGTIFAYGQTGSGKTYTISGDQDNPGIVPRALLDIFKAIGQAKEKFDVKMSYLEIYNEHSNDLLIPATDEKKKILLRESSDKIMEWHNLSLYPVQSYSEAIDLLAIGDSNRIVCDTPMNIFSSRSHTILTIYLTASLQDTLEIRKAKLNLVDLAGSERVHKTGEEGIVLEEARHINLSLHYLEQVIVALSDSSRSHVPYRNCTMTSALRDSLGGNCITVMIANVAVNKANVEETVSTCRFAQRVALVRNDLSVNAERDLVGENSLLREEIQQLREQCSALQTQVQALEQTKPKENEQSELLTVLQEELEKVTTGVSVLPTLPHPQPRETITSTPSQPVGLSTQQLQKVTTGVSVLPTLAHPQPVGLSTQQLQTDIIHLIGWLQDELKAKNRSCGNNDTTLSSSSVLSTEEKDERFEDFISTVEVKGDWLKLKEEEQKVAEALRTKVNAINSVHLNILSWWRRHEKSLVQEVLVGRPLKLGTTADLTASVLASPRYNASVDSLLGKHSNLLTDFQLLKSRLKNSKRSLQRVQRKYSMEFNDWKKNERMKPEHNWDEPDIHDLDALNNKIPVSPKMYLKYYNGIVDNLTVSSVKHGSNNTNKCILNDEALKSETSFSLCESDLNTTLGELNDSVFSTSTLVSDVRLGATEGDEWPTPQLRLVRSVPSSLHTQQQPSRHLFTRTLRTTPTAIQPYQLTGDQEIDDEIIAFYRNKYLN